ncbi:MAG TPA: gliding motility protein GldN, partial [Saprospiraceae bacterium]|nr:gliding motility protein GldN [Saprospiraceae bacterium]
MKIALSAIIAVLTLLATPLVAQFPGNIMTESGETDKSKPLDDIVEKRTIMEKRVLPYDPVREADIFFEKRIWRVIDVREKMNLPFA